MSYYMGDYYRGDPGIGSFFKGLASTVAGFIPGVGPIISKGISALPGGARPAAGAITAATRGVVSRVGASMVKHPVLSAAGAAGALGAMGGAVAEHVMAGGGACPRGFHPSKSKHAKHSCSRNRRMNSCNPRGLRRAVRRLHSFAKHYRHVVGFVSPRPKKGRMYFRKKKRA